MISAVSPDTNGPTLDVSVADDEHCRHLVGERAADLLADSLVRVVDLRSNSRRAKLSGH